MFGDTWVSDCRREGKHSRDTGNREEEEKEKEEEEDGRQADLFLHGGRQSEQSQVAR